MGFEFTEEQHMIRETVRRLAKEKVAPRATQIDETNEFLYDLKEAFVENGLLKMGLPQEHGGIGANVATICMVMEEMSKVSFTGASFLFSVHLIIELLLSVGNEEQKKRFFNQLSQGDKIAAMAVTEPNVGSDLSSMRTRAVLKGDYYILNGTKCFISLGGVADLYGVFASTCPHKKTKGLSAFIVLRETNGLSVGKIENPMGMRGAAGAEIIFEDAKVPKENLLGKEGDGFMILVNSLNVERLWFASMALGTSQGALDYAVQYAKQRVQFGRPIAEFQGIQFMLADMAIQIEVGRSILYDAASEIDRGIKNDGSKSAIAKFFITDTAMKVTTDAVQILGGYGYIKEYPVERMMRDAKATQIAAGTNQIQRVLIARSLLRK